MRLSNFRFVLRGLEWRVVFCQSIHHVRQTAVHLGLMTPKEAKGYPDAYGVCFQDFQTIIVAAHGTPEFVRSTLLHELNHALIHIISLHYLKKGSNINMEEIIVESMAHGMAEVLPQLPKWVIQGFKRKPTPIPEPKKKARKK